MSLASVWQELQSPTALFVNCLYFFHSNLCSFLNQVNKCELYMYYDGSHTSKSDFVVALM